MKNITKLKEKIRYYFDVSSDKQLLLKDILTLIDEADVVAKTILRKTGKIIEQDILKYLQESELTDSVITTFLATEDNRGDIFNIGYLMGQLDEKKKILGENK